MSEAQSMEDMSVRELIRQLSEVEDRLRLGRDDSDPATWSEESAALRLRQDQISAELRHRRERPVFTWYHNHRPVPDWTDPAQA